MTVDQDTLTLLMAMTSDDKRLAVLKEIDDAREKAKAAQTDAEKALSAVQDEALRCQRLKAEADAMHQSMEGRAAELDAREAKMAEVQAGIQAEHQKWETEVRQPTDATQKQVAGDLLAREQSVSFRENEVADREAAVARQAKALQDGLAGWDAMSTELMAVLQKHGKQLGGTGG